MVQFKEITASFRDPKRCTWIHDLTSVAKTVNALDKVEVFQQSAAFLRRILLLRLSKHRDKVLEEVQQKQQRHRRPEILVYDKLICDAYPQLAPRSEEESIDEWREGCLDQRKALKNRLTAARNWRLAVEIFSLGIIALVPTGGLFQVQNHR